MKINGRHVGIVLMILFFFGGIFGVVDSFTGNPVSAYIAGIKMRAYAANKYPSENLKLSKVKYNFKDGDYFCHARSPKSKDTVFEIEYSHGQVGDDYKYEVANHFTAYRRLSKDFNYIVTNIIQKGYPHKTSMIIGDLIGNTQLLPMDKPLDLKNMPLKQSLTVYAFSDVRNEEKMADMLLELHKLMIKNDIHIDEYSLNLMDPKSQDGKPNMDGCLYLDKFSAKKITEDKKSLIEAIHQREIAMEKEDKK